jgi:hypothetical protein
MQNICMNSAGPDCYLVSNATTYVSNAAYYSLSYFGSFLRFGGNGGGQRHLSHPGSARWRFRSLAGGKPKKRAYSRLNCEGLS